VKTCHASNMMQDSVKATYRPTATTQLSETWCFNCSIIVTKENWISSYLK